MIEHATSTGHLSPVSNDPDDRRRRVWRERLIVAGVALVVGQLALTLGALEGRWIAYLFAAIVIVPIFAIARQRERLLTTVFLLSIQIDVYIRLLYGRAGTSGLEIPLCAMTGAALWAQLRYGEGHDAEYRWFGALKRPIQACLLTTAIAVVFSEERFASVGRLFFELQLFFVYSLAMNVVIREGGIARPMQLLAWTLCVQSILCIVQSRLGVNFSMLGDVSELGDIPRPGGTVSTNPAGFASFIMPIITVLTARYVSRDRETRRTSDGVFALLGITAIVLTFTRAAWVGLVLGLAWVVVVGYRRRYITVRQVMTVAAAAAVIFSFALPMMQERLSRAPVSDSYDERARLNQIALQIIGENPLFGLGPGAYDFRFKRYIGADWSSDHWIAGVHNEYLLRAAETGIPGGAAYVWVLLAALAQARKLSRSSDKRVQLFALGWAGGLLALAWQMYWVPWRGFSYNAILWLFMGMSEGLERLTRARESLASERTQ